MHRNARSKSALGNGILVTLGAALIVGCVVQAAPSGGNGSAAAAGSAPPTGTAEGTTTATTHPMVVEVDADRTLVASPGQGVGVFTEYQSGGHWHVWWTCDTDLTSQPCDYSIDVSVSSGAISNLEDREFSMSDRLAQVSSQEVAATTHTTTGTGQVLFDTDPGASIQLDAQLSPQPASPFLFFVEDAKVNGGYAGALTNPLILHPSTP